MSDLNYSISLPDPLDHQLPVLLSSARLKVVACGRRWGKTVAGLLAAVEGHGPGRRLKGALDGARVWWVAPSYPIATEIWRDLKRAVSAACEDKSETERRIVLPGGGSVTVRSADNPDSLRGVGLDGLVFDEAASAPEEAWREALRPTLADRCGWALFISSPKGENWFKALYDGATGPNWARWQRPTSDNPLVSAEELEAARREMGQWAFSREFLAEFTEPGGGLFKRDWLRRWTPADSRPNDAGWVKVGPDDERPLAGMTRFATVDLACSVKAAADYTTVSSWALTHDRLLLLLDVDRRRMEGPQIIPAVRAAVTRHALSFAGIEAVGFQLALVQQARAEGLPVRELKPDRDKVSRALPATAWAERGGLLLPSSAHWLGDFESELLGFPGGAHDDQVDTLSYAVDAARTLAVMANLDAVVPIGVDVPEPEDERDDSRPWLENKLALRPTMRWGDGRR